MEQYEGCHIGCAPGTHEGLVAMIRRHTDPCSGVLDIGAHSGALLRRLRNAGFDGLWGADLDATRFDVPGAGFKQLELNTTFAKQFERQFRLITATDVIEHLDSPRSFLAECHRLLQNDGWLAISLPNIAFWEGRLKFLLTGELWGFGEKNYRSQRHISPMTREQMILTMRELGFEVVEHGTAGSFATPFRILLTAPLFCPLRALTGPSSLGESALYLARKTQPDTALREPLHYRSRWAGSADRIGIDDQS